MDQNEQNNLKQAAVRLAWETGRLTYLLKPVQRRIYQEIQLAIQRAKDNNLKELIYVLNCSRRLGKTTTLAVIALETAIRNINFQVHFGAPYQNALKDILLPIFRELIRNCPQDLKPEWKAAESKWVFPNGSFVKICGTNNGQFDNLRGNKSDLFLLDEAAQIDELETVVKDIALPQLLSSTNPNKQVILASTPPTTPDHIFKKYAEKAMAKNRYSHFEIWDGWYDKAEIDVFAEESGGYESTTFRREYLAQFVTDSVLAIVPEWKTKDYVKILPKDDYFKFYFQLEALDIGFRDFTAWILGYYDFLQARLVIEYEFALRENEFSTDVLAQNVKLLEADYNKENATRIRRVADSNNLNMLADLSKIYKLPFVPVVKKGSGSVNAKEWMVNKLRQAVKNGKIFIHPRCKMLIASLEFGIWKRSRDEFDRSSDLGHYDFIDALVYMVSYLLPAIENVNPIPPLYQIDVHKTMFPGGIPKDHPNSQNEELKKLFKPRW